MDREGSGQSPDARIQAPIASPAGLYSFGGSKRVGRVWNIKEAIGLEQEDGIYFGIVETEVGIGVTN